MPRYEKANAEVGQVVERMTERYHPQVRDAKVTITCLMAYPLTDENGDSKGPALKHQGYPAQAVVKIIGLKERTDGRADAEIVIDGDNWQVLSAEERDALIDHELEHLELKIDREGILVRDDLDRPKLVCRKHDFQAGWFDSIVRRHGRASPELKQFAEFTEVHYQQRWLPYLDDPDQTPVIAEPLKELPAGESLPPAADDSVSVGGQTSLKREITGELKKLGILANSKGKPRKPRAFAGKPAKGGRKAAMSGSRKR